MYYRYGEISAPLDVSGRIDIIRNYASQDSGATEIDTQTALMRLSYVNVGTYAVNEFDSGIPGDTFRYAAVFFIPRFLWPEKPVLTEISNELNFSATGNFGSAVSTGLGVEFYWNFGWLGILVGGLGMGTLLYLWSLYSIRVQEVGAWHLFAVVLLGMKMGTRSDGFFVVDVLSPFLLATLGHFALSVVDKVIAVRKRE
jgi:hypothetical protein